MGVVPQTRLGKLEFYEAHLAAWSANAVGIGLTATEVTDLTALVTAARAQFNAQQTAKDAAKAATLGFHDKADAMQSLGSELIRTIKLYAQTKNDPGVLVVAQLPKPLPPTPAGPPVAPTDLTASMNSDGSIRLAWKGSVAQRQFFSVWRQLPSQSMPLQIGSVAAKEFTDLTVPRGLTQVVYCVRAHRDAQVSVPSPNVVVYFGAIPGAAGGSGAMVNGEGVGIIDPEAAARRLAA